MKLFLGSTLMVATQANFFRHSFKRHSVSHFLGSGSSHKPAEFHAVFKLYDNNQLDSVEVEYYNCDTNNASTCLADTSNKIKNVTLGSLAGSEVTVDANNGVYDLRYTPTTFNSNNNEWPNHILTKIDLTDASVLEESFMCQAGKVPKADGSACDACAVGSFAVRGQTSCTECSAGQYQDQSGKTSCDTIPDGQQGQSVNTVGGAYVGSGASYAVHCKEGFTGDGTGACASCQAGQSVASGGTSSSGGTSCANCLVGTARAYDSDGGCTTCAASNGKYQDQAGQASCKTCSPPSQTLGSETYVSAICTNTANTGFMACGSCTGGTVQDDACVAGTYSGTGSAQTCESNMVTCTCADGGHGTGIQGCTTCTGCNPGFTLSNGACNACPDGEYSNGATCTDCPAGKKGTGNDGNQATACVDCAAGKWSTAVGTNSSHVCTDCVAGKYNHLAGQATDTCKDCPTGKDGPAGAIAPYGAGNNVCEWKVTMYGYVLTPDDPLCTTNCPCSGLTNLTKPCVHWHGELTDGFNLTDIEEETTTAICNLLKDDGVLLKASVCN